ncbi:MAG TPA: hypothetical protein DGT23_23530 [Micromonosporaceae bacterium]|nr:hypothetical protein [Micromonosporaceae bacterium]
MALVAGCTPKNAPVGGPVLLTDRVSWVDVPVGYEPQLEFYDSANGYALFVKWEQQRKAEAILFRTKDGGATWQKLTHPRPVAENQQLYAAGPQDVVLWAEPHGWYVSQDSGDSWQETKEDQTSTDFGRFFIDYGPGYAGPALIRDREQPGQTSPVPPGFEHARLTNDSARVWLAAVKNGQPITTRRGTGDFEPVSVPKQPGRDAIHARVDIAAGDVWLIAEQDSVMTSSGTRGVARASVLKGTGLPLVWQLVNGAWVARPFTGIEEKPGWPYSVAPVGDGALIVAGGGQTGYFRGGFYPVLNMQNLDWVSALPDGTVLGRTNRAGTVYLGQGTGMARNWVRVEVSRA